MRTRTRIAASGAALALVVAACTVEAEGEDPADMEPVEEFPGDEDDIAEIEDPDDPDPADDPDEPVNDEDADVADELDIDAPEEAAVAVAASELGEHLTDGEGRAIYATVLDGDGVSSCIDECLARWPIVPAEGDPVVGDGVDEELLDAIGREDGTRQITYAGYPLHRYAGDDEPGDLTGHGLEEEWSVISPEGELLLEQGDS